MRFFDRSTLAFFGLSLALVACGGSHREAEAPKAPATDVASGDGSSVPDPTPTTTQVVTSNPPASETAKASTKADGSDIIPPFPSAGGKKPAAPARASKKSGKKKVAATE